MLLKIKKLSFLFALHLELRFKNFTDILPKDILYALSSKSGRQTPATTYARKNQFLQSTPHRYAIYLYSIRPILYCMNKTNLNDNKCIATIGNVFRPTYSSQPDTKVFSSKNRKINARKRCGKKKESVWKIIVIHSQTPESS